MIWIIGTGMLGTELLHLCDAKNLAYIHTDREIDITDKDVLLSFAEEKHHEKPITSIINCAAYTNVNKAEDDADICYRINAEGARNVSLAAEKTNADLIHISTDYVFRGTSAVPYQESDETDPITIYGKSKRDGERYIKHPGSYIIRTAWLYGKYGNNFVKTMIQLMNERDSVSVVNDQQGSPTWAFDLAQTILKILERSKNDRVPYGMYHYTNEGSITWYSFAKEIYQIARELGIVNRDCKIRPCTTAEYPTRAVRPQYSVLDKSKIKKALGEPIPQWDLSLKEFLVSCER
jgi:dTDP-4-dehydrorhamnose reductase